MSKTFKVTRIAVLILAGLSFVWLLYTDYIPHRFEGIVYDCETGQAIPGAVINVSGNNTLIDMLTFHWDSSTRKYSDITDQTGNFLVNYRGQGIGGIYVTKEGYLRDQEHGSSGKTRIGLLKEKYKGESVGTNMCRRCSKTDIVDGVIVFDYSQSYDDLCPPIPLSQL